MVVVVVLLLASESTGRDPDLARDEDGRSGDHGGGRATLMRGGGQRRARSVRSEEGRSEVTQEGGWAGERDQVADRQQTGRGVAAIGTPGGPL